MLLQSEVAVASLVDFFVLLVSPGGGDELQGLKRGVMEHVDLVVVTKADGDLAPAARHAQYEYAHALKLLPPRLPDWRPRVLRASSVTHEGLAEVWEAASTFRHQMQLSGQWERQRVRQREERFWTLLDEGLRTFLRSHPRVTPLPALLQEIRTGAVSPARAVQDLLSTLTSAL